MLLQHWSDFPMWQQVVSGSKFSNGRVDNEIIVKRYAREYTVYKI